MTEKILNYRVSGDGYPVLFLHGFLESMTMWDHIDLKSLGIKAVLIDLPGHGKSSNEDDNEPSIGYMTKKVIEVARHLELDSFSVVGHSMGGYVALDLKRQLSVECEKVVLLNSNFWEDSESKKNDRLRVAEIVFNNKNIFIREAVPNLFVKKETMKKEVQQLVEEALKMDKHAIAYASLAMRNRSNFKNSIEQNPKNFLIIQGELDAIVPVENMKKEVADVDVRLEILKDVGHMAHFEAPRQVEKLLAAFFLN